MIASRCAVRVVRKYDSECWMPSNGAQTEVGYVAEHYGFR
jgi:seryl-tRNA synthetase